jgi:hypothetical protein
MASFNPLGPQAFFTPIPTPGITPAPVPQTVLTAAAIPPLTPPITPAASIGVGSQPALAQIVALLQSLLTQLGGGSFTGALGVTPAAVKPAAVPLADVAAGFDTLQNGEPIDPAVLAEAAGDDGILTQEEAAALDGVTCINKETGEELPIGECMIANDVTAIDVASAVNTPIADVAAGFDTLQNGEPIDPAVLAAAAGADGILTRAEAATLDGVVCINKATGEELPIAECMIANDVYAINLGTAADAEGAGGAGDADGEEDGAGGAGGAEEECDG